MICIRVVNRVIPSIDQLKMNQLSIPVLFIERFQNRSYIICANDCADG